MRLGADHAERRVVDSQGTRLTQVTRLRPLSFRMAFMLLHLGGPP